MGCNNATESTWGRGSFIGVRIEFLITEKKTSSQQGMACEAKYNGDRGVKDSDTKINVAHERREEENVSANENK